MSFAIVQAGSALQAVSTSGTIVTLTLPTGVTIDSTLRGQFHILGKQLLFTGAATINLWIDPVTLTVRSMVIVPPTAAPTLATNGTGLTGSYVAAYTFGVIDTNGNLINESGLSDLSDALAVTNQGINWTNIQVSPDSSVNCRVLYRSLLDGNGETLFRRTIIADNVTTSFLTDNLPDSGLELLPAFADSDPPEGTVPGTRLQLAVSYRDRIFAVGTSDPDSLRWTEPGSFYQWPSENEAGLTVRGEDQYGCQGFLPRKEELVILKRSKVLRFVGSSNDDFEMMPDDSSQNVGCIAPLSCVVISDVGYFLGPDGVYAVDSAGVRNITRDTVDPWFSTDLYFNRPGFYLALGGYNPATHSYELYLTYVGSATGVIDRWISYDIEKGKWYGPHYTAGFTPSARGMLKTSGGLLNATIGGTDGYLYYMNQSLRSDLPGATPLTPSAITAEWIHSYFDADSPDFLHFWGMPTYHYQNEGVSAGTVTVSWYTGDLVASSFPNTGTFPLTTDRYRMTRLGTGRLMRMKFTHATAGENFLLRGMQIPFNTIGRR